MSRFYRDYSEIQNLCHSFEPGGRAATNLETLSLACWLAEGAVRNEGWIRVLRTAIGLHSEKLSQSFAGPNPSMVRDHPNKGRL
jgi:hypothetical protein